MPEALLIVLLGIMIIGIGHMKVKEARKEGLELAERRLRNCIEEYGLTIRGVGDEEKSLEWFIAQMTHPEKKDPTEGL